MKSSRVYGTLNWYTFGMRHYVKVLSVPLLFLLLYSSLNVIWNIFNLPPPDRLAEIVGGWFDTYGVPALFLASFLEGMLLVGSYFPGVFVIFLGVLVADSASGAALSVVVATLGLILAHILNYFMGKYGWYKLLVKFGMKDAIEQSKSRLEKRGPIAIPLSYWLPSIGALTNTAAGIIRMSFRKFLFYSIASSIFWYSLVGLVVYQIGDSALEVAGGGAGNLYVFSIIALWILIVLVLDFREKRSSRNGRSNGGV